MSPLVAYLHTLEQWEWLPILLVRWSVGGLFFLSGHGKLFRADRREQMRRTLVEAGIPWAPLLAVFVSLVEWIFGALLMVGLLTPLCCIMLGGNMVVAIATSRLGSISARGSAEWLSEFLYLPELLCVLMLGWLFFSGPGWLSVDHLAGLY